MASFSPPRSFLAPRRSKAVMQVIPDLLHHDAAVEDGRKVRRAEKLQRGIAKKADSNLSQENAAPNLFAVAGLASQPGQAKRTQKKAAQRSSSKKMAAAAAAAVVAGMVAEQDSTRGERSPHPGKQEKVGGGAIALAHRALAIEVADEQEVAGGSWQSVQQVSPPLNKAQERHMAFAQRARAFATRGSSKLAVSGREAREFDGLAVGVEGCAI